MNFDEVNVQQLHAQTFQTIDLFQLKTIWSDGLPHDSYRVTDFSELNLHVTKPELLQLRWIDLTLPIGIYSNEKLVFLYDPYHRKLHTEKVVSIELAGHDISFLDYLLAHSQTFHYPDSFSAKMESLYDFSWDNLRDSQWREFYLPKLKEPTSFITYLLVTLGAQSFHIVSSKNEFLSGFEIWAKRTGCDHSIERIGKWMWSKTYKVSCDVSQLSEHALHQLVSLVNLSEEWEGIRFLIPTKTETVSLFIGDDFTQGEGYGVFQYKNPGEVISNEI
ncbi:hypothetical protein EVJ33_05845 [Exiguobacterium sp. SL-10]|uniref:hypothetical protein n=1 Tax=Exiguobacterium sp. SL-10 TaxID=2510962 RepID=UPI001038F2EE|nr:hypothetical protein [Exiguobacterium sp. SL-10]TCI30810.1 hypothetical protein EVJ33_05845 [Exiguobacterium sp. SL-10]